MDEFVKATKSLSDPQRVRVLNLLMQRECCVCQVMEVLSISQVNASRYCHALLDAGFLKMHKEGRWRHYRVDVDACSPSLRGILESVREAAKSDPVMLTDIQRLAHTAPGVEHNASANLARQL
ncbi:MAG: ArsR/SmtB family transcription factor [Chloroflexota bacterium]